MKISFQLKVPVCEHVYDVVFYLRSGVMRVSNHFIVCITGVPNHPQIPLQLLYHMAAAHP